MSYRSLRVCLQAIVASLTLTNAFFVHSVAAGDLGQLRVIYVGDERSDEFVRFLSDHVAHVETTSRDGFNPADAEKFDVVLLDWPQSADARSERTDISPLGKRENWGRPTVLLGSAGLNLACAWRLRGGSGCTCLDPIAYDLKDHPIFDSPFAIDRSATVEFDTPSSFQDDLEAKSINVIPIVEDYEKNWRAGWCTYSTAFDVYPEVEFFCGGVNHKIPTAAAIWRQGNLMHFGFQQSPAEMNDIGDKLLLNAIAYISDFSEDRPIAITPSIFVGPSARPRATIASWLGNPERSGWVKDLVTPELWDKIESQGDASAMTAWAQEHTPYFTTDADSKLEIDIDLQAIKMGFDDPRFIESTITALSSDDATVSDQAKRLLERYVPDGPSPGDGGEWQAWHAENRPYLFATDCGLYRWYVDPLAKQRGIPTLELRNGKRSDLRSASR